MKEEGEMSKTLTKLCQTGEANPVLLAIERFTDRSKGGFVFYMEDALSGVYLQNGTWTCLY